MIERIRDFVKEYYADLESILSSIIVTDKSGAIIGLSKGMKQAVQTIMGQGDGNHKIILIGNGASAAISSHIATDLWKNGGVRALAFNDISLLTAVSNDYGYQHVFEKPIELFGNRGDVLMAISSSGNSENIIRAASAANKKGLTVITFSGFDKENSLRTLGSVNFYAPAARYGHVEITHLSICHCLVDMIIKMKNG